MVYSDPKYKARDKNKKSSQRKNNKIKNQSKPLKKGNYKKKSASQMVECCICFQEVSNTSDNSVQCGKTTHFICGECKFRCNETGNDKCPMCRSHPIKNPVSREIVIPIYYRCEGRKIKKPKSMYPDDSSRMSLKQRRNYYRNSTAAIPFHENSNRIIRERTNWTSRPTSRRRDYDGWVPANRPYHPNQSDYSDSDTASTLTLVDEPLDTEDEYPLQYSGYIDMVTTSHE